MRAVLLVIGLFLSVHCFSQVKDSSDVQLIEWNEFNCDDTYDPYRLKNRITNIERIGDITSITVSFKENCCPSFYPTIEFEKGVLNLIPYTEKSGMMCACDCCFSMEFLISGLPEEEYTVQFHGKTVEYSTDYYDTRPPTSEMYKGKVINRRNKYGFQEGTWIRFYEDSSIKYLYQFPESVLYSEAYHIWAKRYHENGRLAHWSRNDTIQNWFDDGTLKYEHIKYKIGDTTFTYKYSLHDNGKIDEKSLQTSYPVTHRSKFNDCYEANGRKFPYVRKETYYENGQIKFLLGVDTTKQWHSNGQLKDIYFDSRRIEYDSLGNIMEKTFYWDLPGQPCSMDLRNTLYIKYGSQENVQEIRLNRYEKTEKSITLGANYYWEWDSEGVLVKSPEDWNEELPWLKFPEIQPPAFPNKHH